MVASTRLRRVECLRRFGLQHVLVRVVSFLLSSTIVLTATPGPAATYTWDADANAANGTTDGSGTWSTLNSNWFLSGTDIGWTNSANDIAQFGGGSGGPGSYAIVLDPTINTVGGIQFAAGDSSSFNFHFGTNATLNLGLSGITVGNGAGAESFDSSIAFSLAGSESFTNNSSNTLTVSGLIAGSTTAPTTMTIQGTGSGTTILGSASGGIFDGNTMPTSLVVASSGMVKLASSGSAYSGSTTVSSGTLQLGVSNAIPSSSMLVVQGTGKLDLNGFNDTVKGLSDGGVSTGIVGNGSTTAASTLTIAVPASTTDTFTGVIKDTIGAGNRTVAVKINNNATGVQVLSGANTYTGITTLTSGTLNVTSLAVEGAGGGVASSIGSAGNAAANLVINGGILQYTGSTAATTDRSFTIGTSGATLDASGDPIFGGSLTFNSSTPAIAFSSANTAATLTLTGSGSAGASGTLAAKLGNNGTGVTSLTKSGTETWTLAAADTYNGTTTIKGGTLQVGDGTIGSLNGTTGTALTFTGTGTFLVDEAASSTQGMGALTFSGGDGSVQSTFVGTSATLTVSSLAARSAGGTGNFISFGGTNGTSNSINLTGVAAGFINQGMFFGGSNYAWMNGAGTFVRGINYGVDAGSATSGATTSVAGTNYQQITGSISAEATNSFLTLNINGNNNFTLASSPSATVTVNGILKSGGFGGATISGGTALKAANGAELVIRTDGFFDALTINTPIIANGTNALTKTGAGTLTLGAANSYTGVTTIDNGVLNVGSLAVEGAGGGTASVLGSAGNAAANLVINGGIFQYTGATGQATDRSFKIGPAGATLDASGTSNGSLTFNNSTPAIAFSSNTTPANLTLTGSGTGSAAGTLGAVLGNSGSGTNFTSLAKNGTGTWILSATNTFTGTTTINGGTLQLGDGVTNNGSVAGGIVSNSSLVFANPNSQTYAGTISGTGSVTKSASGRLTLTGANTYTGGTNIAAGTLSFANGALGSSGTIRFTGNSTLQWNGGNTQDISSSLAINDGVTATLDTQANSVLLAGGISAGNFSSAVGLTKAGSGKLTLSGFNYFYDGVTVTVSAGTLAIGGNNALYSPFSSVNLFLGDASTTTNNSSPSLLISGPYSLGDVTVQNQPTSGTYTIGGNTANTSSFGTVTLNQPVTLSQTPGGGVSYNGIAGNGNAVTFAGGGSISDTSYGPGISGTGTSVVVNNSGGIVRLSAANSYTGATMVSAGTLQLNSPGSLAATPISVASGATFSALPNGGTIMAGGSLSLASGAIFDMTGEPYYGGTLSLGGSLSLSGATLKFGLGGFTTVDRLASTSAPTVSGTNTINIVGFGTTNISAGTYSLITATSGTALGTSNFTLGTTAAVVNGQSWHLALDTTPGTAEQLIVTAGTNGAWTQTGSGGPFSWGDAGNWTDGIVPGAVADAATFGTATANNQTINLDQARTVGAVNFNNTAATSAGGNYTLAGNGFTLTLDAEATPPSIINSTGSNTVSAPLALNGTAKISVASGTQLSLTGTVANGTSANGLTMNGPGTLTLSGTNTYSGPTTLNGGTLNINSAQAVGTGTLILNGGTIDNTSGAPLTLTNNNPQTWTSFTFAGTNDLNLGTGAVTFANNYASVTLAAGTLSVGGAISNPYGVLAKDGSGSLTLAGDNSLSSLYIYAGTVTLSGSNPSLAVTLYGGRILLNQSTNGKSSLGQSPTIQLSGGTLSDVGSSNTNPAAGTTYIYGGPASVTTSNTTGHVFAIGQVYNEGGPATIAFTPYSTGIGAAGSITASPGSGSVNGIFSGWATYAATVGGATDWVDGSSSTVAPYSGYLNDSFASAATNTNITANGSPSSPFTVNSLRFNAATARTLTLPSGTNTLTSGGILETSTPGRSATGDTITGGAITAAAQAGVGYALFVHQFDAAAPLTIASSITDNSGGALQLIKAGPGILNVSGANTFTGGTNLGAGTLSFANGALGTSGTITFTGNSTLQWNAGNTQDISSRLAINGGVNATFDTQANNVTLAANMNISGYPNGASLTKAGSGTLTLAGSNDFFDGLTATVSAGTLAINNSNALGGTVNIFLGDANTTANNSSPSLLMSGPYSLGNVTVQNQPTSGTYTIGGNTPNTSSFATVTLNQPVTLSQSPGGTVSYYGIVGNGNAVTFVGGGSISDTSYGPGISGAGTSVVVNNSGGIVRLSAANSYTGATTVSAGTLQLNSPGSLAATPISVASGATFSALSNGGTVTAAGSLTLASGAILDLSDDPYGGTLNLGSSLSLSGATLKFGLGGFSTVNLLASTGAPTVSGTNTINIVGSGTSNISAGTYNLITATAGAALGTANFTLGTDAAVVNGQSWHLSLGTTPGTAEQLIVAPGTNGGWAQTGSGGPFSWGDAGNWTDGIVPGAVADAASFGTATANNQTINLDQARTVGAVNFNNTAATSAGGNYTLAGNGFTLTLDAEATPPSIINSTGSNTVSAPLALNGTAKISVASGTQLSLTGTVANGTSANGLTMNGPGTLTLSGTNTYSGPTTLNGGTLNINSAQAVGPGALVLNGGTVDNTSGAPLTLTSNNPQIWAGGFTFTGTNDLNLGSGAVNLINGYASVIVTGGTLTVGGAISRVNGSLNKYGAGTLNLTGANALTSIGLYAGTLALNQSTNGQTALGPTVIFRLYGGTLSDGGSSNTNPTAGTTYLYGGPVNVTTSGTTGHVFAIGPVYNFGGAATIAFTPSSTGTGAAGSITASPGSGSVNGIFSGWATYAATVGGATDWVDASSSTVAPYSGYLNDSFASAATNTNITANDSPSSPFTVNSLRFNAAAPVSLTLPAGTSTLTSGGILETSTPGRSAIGDTITGGALTASAQSNVGSALIVHQFDTTAPLTIASAITGVKLIKAGPGTLTLSGANTYSGGTYLGAGMLSFANGSLGSSGSITFTGNSTLQWNGTNTQDISGRLAINDGIAATLDTEANNVTLAGGFGGFTSGSLTKVGSGSLTLTGSNFYTGGTKISGGTLSFASNSLYSSGAITFAGNSTLQWNGTNTQDISSRLVINNGVTATLDTQGNNVVLSSAFGANGSGSLSKIGSGILTLTGANSYTGGTNLNAGTVSFSSGGLGASGAITFAGNSTLRWNGINTRDISSRLAINGGVTATLDTQSNNVTLASAFGTPGSSGLTKLGTGTLTLSGANTYGGATTISAGRLNVASLAVEGSGGGAASSLGGAGNAATNLVINGGTLQFTGSTAQTTDRSFTIGTSGATLDASGTSNGALTFNSSTPAIAFSSTASPASLALTGTGAGNAAGTLGAALSDSGIGSNITSLTKSGTGTWFISGADTYTGSTTVSAGTLALGGVGALGNGTNNTSSVSVSSGAVLNLAGISPTANVPLSVTGTGVGSGALANSSATAATFGGIVTIGSGGASIGGSGNIILSAGLSSNANALTKVGADVLTLSAASGRSGTVSVSAGTLLLGVDGALGTSTTSATVSSGAALDLNGINYSTASGLSITGQFSGTVGALTDSSATAATYGGTVTIGSGGASIGGNGDISLSQAVATNANALTKIGGDTLFLTAASSRTGTTTLSGGILDFVTNSLGSSPGNITFNGGLLQYGPSTTQDLSAKIVSSGSPMSIDTNANNVTFSSTLASSNTGGLAKLGSGSLTLSGANSSFTGGTTINAGTLGFVNGALGSSGSIMFTGNSALQWSGTNTQDISSRLAINNGVTATLDTQGNNVTLASAFGANGSGSLTKIGSGTLALTGANTYTGGTNLSAGKVSFANGSLGSSGAITFTGNSTLQWNGTNTQDISGRLAINNGVTATLDTQANNVTLAGGFGGGGSGALTKIGAGTLTLTGTDTYTGPTTISGGVLIVGVGGSGSIATSPVTIGSTGTLKGSGATGSVTINSGGTLSPGNSPGTLSSGDANYNGGASYTWEINSVAGGGTTASPAGNLAASQGHDPGWDFQSVTGTLTINSTSGSPFNVNVTGLNTSNAAGATAFFNQNAPYAWNLATASTAISGFTGSNQFAVSTANFTNFNSIGSGSFSVSTTGSGANSSLYLAYTPNTLGVMAADNASNYSSFGGSATLNKGAGYGNWQFTPANNTGTAGYFLGDAGINAGGSNSGTPSGNWVNARNSTATNGTSWGLYANSNDVASAVRPVTGGLPIGQTFALDVDNGYLNNGSSQGFSLLNSTSDTTNGRLFEFFFKNGGANAYSVTTGGSSTSETISSTASGFTGNGLHVEFTQTSATAFTMTVSGPNFVTQTITGSLLTPTAGNSLIASFRPFAYNANASDTSSDFNGFFNNALVLLPTWNGQSAGAGGGNFSSAKWAAHAPVNGGSIAFDGTGSIVTDDAATSGVTSLYNIQFNATGAGIVGASGPNVNVTTNAGVYTLQSTGLGAIGLSLGGGITNNSTNLENITLTGSGAIGITLTASQTFNGGVGGLSFGASSGINLNGNALTIQGTGAGAHALTIGAAISGSGAGSSLTKLQTGTLVLNAASSYGGTTTIGANPSSPGGTIKLGIANALPTGTSLVFNGGTATPSTLDLAGNSQAVASLYDGGNNSGNITDSGAAATFTLINTDSNFFYGTLTGANLALTKSGSGTQEFGGANTYGGATQVTNGTLRAGAANTLSANSGMTVSGGTLDVSGFANTVKSLTVGGSGTLRVGLGNTLTSTNAASLAGTLNIGGTATLGKYALISYASETGTFGTTNVASYPAYKLVYNGTELDLQHLADQTLTAAAPATIKIIAGAATGVSATLTNTAPISSAALNVALADNGGTGGAVSGLTSSTGSTVAVGSPSSIAGTFTAGAAGLGLTWSIKNTDASALTTTATAGGSVNVYNHSAPTFTLTSGNNQSVIVGGTFVPVTLTLDNTTATTGVNIPAPLDVSNLGNVSGPNGSLAVASNASVSYTATGLSSGTVGLGQTIAASLNAGDSAIIVGANPPANFSRSITYNVYDHATDSATAAGGANTFNGGTLHLGNIHLGYASAVASSDSLTVFNGAAADTRVALSGSGAQTGGSTPGLALNSIGGSGSIGPGGSASIAASLATGLSGGPISRQFTYEFADDAALSGASSNVGTVAISVVGNVYSGLSVWTGASGGAWTSFNNWDSGGAPGLDPNFTTTDTATFGNTAGSVNVDLGGAAPSLRAMTFNATGSYTIGDTVGTGSLTLAGSSPTIAVAGSHTIAVPVALAANTSVTISGVADQLTVSGAITGSARRLTLGGAGTLVLNAANSYGGGTTVSGGTLRVANSTGSATGSGSVTLDGGTLASGSTGSVGGAVIAGSGGHSIAPGGIGTIGTLNFGSSLTLNGNSTLHFDLNGASDDLLAVTGAVSIASGTPTLAFDSVSGLVLGHSYTLATFATSGLTNSSFSTTNVPPGFKIQVEPTDVMLITANASTLSLAPSHLVVRSMLGGSQTGTVTLTELSGLYDAAYSTANMGAATASPAAGNVTAGTSAGVAIGFTDYSATGARAGSVMFSNTGNPADNFNSSGNVATLDAGSAVVDNRVVTATPVDLGVVHVGGVGSGSTNLSTTGDDDHFTRVTVAGQLFNSAGSTGAASISPTLNTPGPISGSTTLPTTGEGLIGESPINVSVPYIAQVFTGHMSWKPTSGSGNYAIDPNWFDLGSSATAGAPGLSGALSIGDSATFDNASVPTTINLVNASPHLAAVTFAGPNSFTLVQGAGSGALHFDNGGSSTTLTASSDGHQITAPITLDSNLSIAVTHATDTLSIGGAISDGGAGRGVTKNGPGTLVLTWANSYGGATQINDGVVRAGASGVLSSNSDHTINSGTLDVSAAAQTIKSLTMDGDATLQVSFGNSSIANTLAITGAANFAGTLAIGGLPTLGSYTLASYGSRTGTFATATNFPDYSLVYGVSNLYLQHVGIIGVITAAPASGSIITGGSLPFSVSVQNASPAGGQDLNFSAAAGANVSGSIPGPINVPAATASAPQTGLSFTGTTIGPNQVGTFTVSDTGANNGPQSGSVTVNVFDHASTGGFSGGSIALPSVIVGYTGPINGTSSLSLTNGNASDYRVDLKAVGGSSNHVAINGFAGVAPGGSGSITASLTTGRAAGAVHEIVPVTLADDSTLNGASSSLSTQNVTVTGFIFGHATASDSSGAAGSFTGGTLNLGNIHQGYSAPVTSLNNLAVYNGAAGDNRVPLSGSGAQTGGTTSGLTLNPIGGGGTLAPGSSATIAATLATGLSAQTINQQFTYTFADDSTLAGASSDVASPTITVTGNVYTGQSIWRGRQPFKGSSDGNPPGDLSNPTWTTFSNWSGGAPGLDPNFTTTDTATLGVQIGNVSIDLDGSSPSLDALTFNGVASYTVMDSVGTGSLRLAGAGAALSVAGSQVIAVPLTIAASTTVNVAAGADRLTVTGKLTVAPAATLTKAGLGSLEIDSAPTLGAGSRLNVNAGTLKFNVASGQTVIGAGATATIASGAKLELAGSISALSSGSSATNQVAIVNNSRQSSGGELLVTGQNQQVAGISGSGDTVVAGGASLTADSIVQNALVIAGTNSNLALLTIAASDASGNPIASAESGGGVTEGVLGGLSGPSTEFTSPAADFGAVSGGGNIASYASNGTDASPQFDGAPGRTAAVPEPATIVLLIVAVMGFVAWMICSQHQIRADLDA